jgi:carboxyl-terminal processing protease
MREADLDRHLTNPTEKDSEQAPQVKPAPQPQSNNGGASNGAPAATTPADKAAAEKKPAEPAEIGSKGDYQLNQAVNLLKGLQIIGKN